MFLLLNYQPSSIARQKRNMVNNLARYGHIPRHLMLLVLFCALGPIITALPCSAQENPDIAVGLVPYQSFQTGDLDAVNLSNGKLTLGYPSSRTPSEAVL